MRLNKNFKKALSAVLASAMVFSFAPVVNADEVEKPAEAVEISSFDATLISQIPEKWVNYDSEPVKVSKNGEFEVSLTFGEDLDVKYNDEGKANLNLYLDTTGTENSNIEITVKSFKVGEKEVGLIQDKIYCGHEKDDVANKYQVNFLNPWNANHAGLEEFSIKNGDVLTATFDVTGLKEAAEEQEPVDEPTEEAKKYAVEFSVDKDGNATVSDVEGYESLIEYDKDGKVNGWNEKRVESWIGFRDEKCYNLKITNQDIAKSLFSQKGYVKMTVEGLDKKSVIEEEDKDGNKTEILTNGVGVWNNKTYAPVKVVTNGAVFVSSVLKDSISDEKGEWYIAMPTGNENVKVTFETVPFQMYIGGNFSSDWNQEFTGDAKLGSKEKGDADNGYYLDIAGPGKYSFKFSAANNTSDVTVAYINIPYFNTIKEFANDVKVKWDDITVYDADEKEVLAKYPFVKDQSLMSCYWDGEPAKGTRYNLTNEYNDEWAYLTDKQEKEAWGEVTSPGDKDKDGSDADFVYLVPKRASDYLPSEVTYSADDVVVINFTVEEGDGKIPSEGITKATEDMTTTPAFEAQEYPEIEEPDVTPSTDPTAPATTPAVTNTPAPKKVATAAAVTPSAASLKVAKKVVVAAGKTKDVKVTVDPSTFSAITATSANEKLVTVATAAGVVKVTATAAAKKNKGKVVKVTVKAGTKEQIVKVAIQNKAKKMKAAKKKVTVKKNKTAKVTFKVTKAENKKAAVTDLFTKSAKKAAKAAKIAKIAKVKKVTVKKGKVIVAIKATKKKGTKKLTLKVGKAKASCKVTVK